MPVNALFDFKDASFKGDPKWAKTSPRFSVYAPPTVVALLVLSIIEIVLGVIWITGINSLSDNLSFAQVVQPLIVPGLSFFNTIPSLHLHVLARSNHPTMAMIFSSLLSLMFLVSAIVWLVPCAGGNATYLGSSNSFQRTECPQGSHRGVWAGNVALQLASGVGYAIHASMAGLVRTRLRRWMRDGTLDAGAGVGNGEGANRGFEVSAGGGGRRMVNLVLTEEEKRKREEEARRRWQEIVDL